ncbi:SusD/RagB family nutrient-binding outer membrane lipoprotein [Elizabethkingia anophelis]|uniref:SusD/RagB family nutrient-binding outer membrane lipoprotein n=1 Tax=Elizabethkingia anophelis TaxID=1117645 RepID=UPI00099AA6B6|nr:SusD/RagB family nutrient-binding outer membrane lipoprotein [Elizabethkingia anophelis]MDV4132210.1 SusD/RagB family nutrient-binding outer membrane lipoprotein [Elizabethkingia anophelis]MDV4135748.1 SusD/RagB family nutrient-binding outer membrane lipoprotein [Elizabethkingia anophelis]OPC58691.1 hypothetical protein BAY08_15340 [Elizabethkingia anophelis]
MKNNKYYKIALIGVISFLSFTSCKDENFGDDYNKDLYGIYDADYKSLMSGAMLNFAGWGQGNSNVYQMMPILFAQYQSQVTYTTEQQYGDTAGAWARFYSNQLINFNRIINAYSSGTVTVGMTDQGSKENMIGVSKIFRAIIYKRITDTYGDAPMTEALRYDEIRNPKYDKQEDIYKAIIKDLKEGRDMLQASGSTPKGDVIYAGDVKKWKKLANSLLLQVTLQLSKKYPGASGMAATEFKAALADPSGLIETLDDEAWFAYAATNLVANPLNSFRAADFRMSRELTDAMKGSATTFNPTTNKTPDYRLTIYATSGTMSAQGLPFGYSAPDLAEAGYSTAGTTTISTKYRSADSPMYLMTASYTFLNRAEGAARGWSAESVNDMLKKGIVLNYNTLDSHFITGVAPFTGTKISDKAEAYANARVADIATAGALRVIADEKWISLFANGFDAWAEWRRTGFPLLKPAKRALNGGIIPRRLRYPQDEANFNKVNYQAGISTLTPGEDKNTSKVWWDQ